MKGLFTLATVALLAAGPVARANTFHDDLTPASVSSYLSIQQSNDGQYSSSSSASGLVFSKTTSAPIGTEYITAKVSISAITTDSLVGDFDLLLHFAQLSLGSVNDYVQLEINFPSYRWYALALHGANTATFANGSMGSDGGSASGSVSATSGTLRLTRVDSTVSGYVNDQLIGAFDNSAPLEDIWTIRFSLYNADSSASQNSVLFTDWTITNANVVPEPASLAILAAGVLGASLRRRSRR